MTKKTVTIFGSAFGKTGEPDYEFAYNLGKELGKKGFSVCNGGYLGTMEATHKGAYESGAHTIGITVPIFNRVPNPYIKEEIRCQTLMERINKLIEKGDAFIVLKGATGTLLEFAAIWELVNKNLIEFKPVIAVKNFWQPLVDLMEKQLTSEHRLKNIVYLSEDINEICNYLEKKLNGK